MKNFVDIARQSSHWDGFEREKALHHFVILSDPRAIPFLLIRLNDWVKVIRELAEEVLDSFLSDAFAQDWIDNLGNVGHLKKCHRKDHSAWIIKVESFLVKDNPSLVVDGLGYRKRDVSRICCELILKHQLMDNFVSVGLSHPDPTIRRKAADQIKLSNLEERVAYLERAITDKYNPVRKIAFFQLLQIGISTEYLGSFLFDRNASIRDIAKSKLIERSVDVRSIFEDLLAKGGGVRMIGVAIKGIGNDQNKEDLTLLQPFLKHLSANVRRCALWACTLILGYHAKAIIIGGLKDDLPGVRKYAARLTTTAMFSARELLSVVDDIPEGFVIYLGVANRMGRWERLIFLLNVGDHPDFSQERARLSFQGWHADSNNSWLSPTKNQLEQIQRGLRNPVNIPFSDSLNFALKIYGI